MKKDRKIAQNKAKRNRIKKVKNISKKILTRKKKCAKIDFADDERNLEKVH